ncbi:hypothetical protein [Micromonospora sp. WMMD812]|uniref:hypothetical protein n=1 Tax=Micromonospora sp. WMMD812 TaxID=3015152 RepID=UPI00248AAD9E|nr:hypothetical protein [Micromonospora sp. WMMD812]WBB65706.1 hypothetical protein O7603_21210 [Micromonospora sp. WMMD812]
MVMVNLPAARRHHRSRFGYAFGILALFGAATTLVIVVRDPALSSTQLQEPVPAPEITVIGEDDPPDQEDMPGWHGSPDDAGDADAGSTADAGTAPDEGSGPDAGALAGDNGTGTGPHSAADIRRSLFWSGIIGLTISLVGLGLVGTRRRMW